MKITNQETSSLTEFKLLMDELSEQVTLKRNQLNQIQLKGDALDAALSEEMGSYEQWRKSKMGYLGNLAKSLTKREKKEARNYVFNSKANQIYQEGPFPWRIFNKPEGYAGDAELMRMIYENKYEGDSPWARFTHKNPLEYRCSNAVRNRKEYLKTKLAKQATGKILSMAAGPAIEIQEFLAENPSNKVECLALDHDINTLRNVKNKDPRLSYSIANAFHFINGKRKIAYPRSTFKNIVNPKVDFKGVKSILAPLKYKIESLQNNSFDLAYCPGLYDYLINFKDKSKGAKALTKFLFDLIKPGGQLIIGNFSKDVPDDEYFAMEFIIDWVLIYRDDAEILSFAESIDESQIADIRIEKEPERINSFLVIEKAFYG